MNTATIFFGEKFGVTGVFAYWGLTAIVHVAFAIGVYSDSQLMWAHLRRKTFFVGGGMWSLATLLAGPLAAALYWLIHHSTLRPERAPIASSVEPVASSRGGEA